ncbi:MAG: hypothetical protein GF320_15985 [Armatimonadia bacterium]|nr:hypothetical protein [Armatimonadia bacterium]
MPRIALWLLAIALILTMGVAVAQDDAAEPMDEEATSAAEEGDVEEAAPMGEAEEPDLEAAEEEGPMGIIEAETEDDDAGSMAAPTEGPTPDPADTGAPLIAYILIGGFLLAAGVFVLRRTAMATR